MAKVDIQNLTKNPWELIKRVSLAQDCIKTMKCEKTWQNPEGENAYEIHKSRKSKIWKLAAFLETSQVGRSAIAGKKEEPLCRRISFMPFWTSLCIAKKTFKISICRSLNPLSLLCSFSLLQKKFKCTKRFMQSLLWCVFIWSPKNQNHTLEIIGEYQINLSIEKQSRRYVKTF